jgi:hypothetical protein
VSRDQESELNDTAKAQNATQFSESQDAVKGAQDTIATQLATNPYAPGGDFSTTTNRQLSNTADVGSATTAEQLQQQAQRTGQNPAAARAAAVAAAQANERALSGEEASAEQTRAAADTGYTAGVEGEQAGLAGTTGSEAGGTLGTQQKAAEDPSFWDQFGLSAAGALGKAVVNGSAGAVGA